MTIYYTEYPTGKFLARNDREALIKNNAKVIYKESESKNGTPFVMIRETK